MHRVMSDEVPVLRQRAASQIMGSEVGVVDIPNWDIASKGRLMPGNIFLVDFDAGRVIKDEEVRPPTHLALHAPFNLPSLEGLLSTQNTRAARTGDLGPIL